MHLYLFTLEIVPLEVGRIYETLPSHLTLMSRFLSDLPADELARKTMPLFSATKPITLTVGQTEILGPKKVTAHMVSSVSELNLHRQLGNILDAAHVSYEYPAFVGEGHKAHVTKREEVYFEQGSQLACSAAYLIEVVDKQRIVRARLNLEG